MAGEAVSLPNELYNFMHPTIRLMDY